MRFDKQKAFPYPVLRPFNDDYEDVEFQSTYDTKIDGDTITLSVEYAISNEEIVNQIKEGNAEYISIISCRDTYFRHVLRSSDSKVEVCFNAGELRGEVRVDPFVYVTRPISAFTSPDFNAEFGGVTFDLDVGDILAQDETQVYFMDRDLFKPVTSVFELVMQSSLPVHEWSLNFSQDHVQICVSPSMKEEIDSARNSQKNRAILFNSIYFAAVMQAIEKLKHERAEVDSFKWAEVILRQAHNIGIELESHDSYISAQRLMKNPLAYLSNYVFKRGE